MPHGLSNRRSRFYSVVGLVRDQDHLEAINKTVWEDRKDNILPVSYYVHRDDYARKENFRVKVQHNNPAMDEKRAYEVAEELISLGMAEVFIMVDSRETVFLSVIAKEKTK